MDGSSECSSRKVSTSRCRAAPVPMLPGATFSEIQAVQRAEDERRRRREPEARSLSAQELDAQFERIFETAATRGAEEACESLADSFREDDELSEIAGSECTDGSDEIVGWGVSITHGTASRGDKFVARNRGMRDRTMSQVYKSVQAKINTAGARCHSAGDVQPPWQQ